MISQCSIVKLNFLIFSVVQDHTDNRTSLSKETKRSKRNYLFSKEYNDPIGISGDDLNDAIVNLDNSCDMLRKYKKEKTYTKIIEFIENEVNKLKKAE